MNHRIVLRVVALPLALALAACSSASPGGSSSSSSASSAPSGASSGGGSTSPASLGGGATGAPGSGTCVPAAPTTFANALCVCDDLGEAGVLRTHAPAGGAASVGVDGRFAAATGSDIEGSLVAYGSLAVAGALEVRDSTLSTGDVDGAGSFDVGGDLSVGGTFGFVGQLTVGGALRLASPGAIVPGVTTTTTAPYVGPSGPPCECDPSSLLPIASLVSAAATNNDNAAQGLGTTGADLLGAGSLALSSGDYYFKDVTRVGAGSISIQGAVAIFIDGSIDEVGDSQITLATGASLDLYVSGVVATAGKVVLGDPAQPQAFRLFVGGAGSLMATAGDQVWNGLVYAPQADVAFAGVTRLDGAVFAKSLDWAGVLDVTYDGLSTSTPCPPPGSAPSPPSASPSGPPSSPSPAPASPH